VIGRIRRLWVFLRHGRDIKHPQREDRMERLLREVEELERQRKGARGRRWTNLP
jgi:hypothetical protein